MLFAGAAAFVLCPRICRDTGSRDTIPFPLSCACLNEAAAAAGDDDDGGEEEEEEEGGGGGGAPLGVHCASRQFGAVDSRGGMEKPDSKRCGGAPLGV